MVNQLDVGHQLQFPVILTYLYACDVRVIRLLHERGLGNSASQLQKKLAEGHSERWLSRTIQYLTECKYFRTACRSGLVSCPTFREPPEFYSLRTYKWFLTAYVLDILPHLDEIKASITSTFGVILKMDSTKKVVKKLAGYSSGTAAWATNIANEMGQVLMSVLTASEGVGLEPMAAGLVKRYQEARVTPPKLLYVDRDCCDRGEVKVREMFKPWLHLLICLDIWHYMRRLALGCTTEAHPLYGVFFGHLSQCIFEWSSDDLELLKKAKEGELRNSGVANPSDELIAQSISKRELATHCRRRTRSVEVTVALIESLIATFSGDQGRDTLGVPLLDNTRIWDIWQSQKKHVKCIHDPEGVQLYVKTRFLLKGGVELPVYRCVRASTSLESFHLHLNRFIPGIEHYSYECILIAFN